MHCPSWDDAFVSSFYRDYSHVHVGPLRSVVHKLRPTGQIQSATSHQVAHKVQQQSLKYEKYGISFIALLWDYHHTDFNSMHILQELDLNGVVIFLCVFNAMLTSFNVYRTILIFSCVVAKSFKNSSSGPWPKKFVLPKVFQRKVFGHLLVRVFLRATCPSTSSIRAVKEYNGA